MPGYDYYLATSRNIGWFAEREQEKLKNKKVAIGGLGGVGGGHLLTLVRLGILNFHIADPDIFDYSNLNRQVGSDLRTLGNNKVDVLEKMAKDINPELNIKKFPEGVTEENIDDFLDGVDIYIDGLDFFVIELRRKVFDACRKKGIPAVSAAAMGMGSACIVFMPDGITFDQYFRLEGCSREEQLLRFLIGLSPKMAQTKYLADPDGVDLKNNRVPSTAIACRLCNGIVGAQTVKILLNRGDIVTAPKSIQFDAYLNKMYNVWVPFGNANPLQKIKLAAARKILQKEKM
ncbi:ThiF family adenylyltransferase [Nitrosophilus alvini]|uniref:ThiF family adenylyltransferase n=1 Tax=Nitrosophilus alvini TaxID=2714855 RepID=UPI00190D4598|nr:ThiF family adenylyltransferase [Nitrosophilus alvini]